MPLPLGCIQGSVCGPKFYNIYANDLSMMIPEGEPTLFADNSAVNLCGNDLPKLTQRMNTLIDNLSLWCKANKLYLNTEKNYMYACNQ